MEKESNIEYLKRYGEEMDQFLDIQFEKGVRYDSPAKAYEDFKNYYDKRLKAAGQAGKRIVTNTYDSFS
jgi:hypothetical protein